VETEVPSSLALRLLLCFRAFGLELCLHPHLQQSSWEEEEEDEEGSETDEESLLLEPSEDTTTELEDPCPSFALWPLLYETEVVSDIEIWPPGKLISTFSVTSTPIVGDQSPAMWS
jgi:hypothetical protein